MYFIYKYCWIEDKAAQTWVPFRLWRSQADVLYQLKDESLLIVLKARQLGLTWLLVCYALWMMLFQPGSGILLFSRRDDEASELLDRLRNVHNRLPAFLQAVVTSDNAHEVGFGGLDSWARAFPTTKHSGRTYTATLAIVDEADFIIWLKRLLNAVKPTIDAGGQLVLLSTADKENRNSEFKRIWHDAIAKANNYYSIFLPWNVRPERNEDWYQRQVQDYEVDDLWQEYPANPEQALAARKASKRFNPEWLTRCRITFDIEPDRGRATPGSVLYFPPSKGRRYLIAADPAEGNPGSDPSAACVLDLETWDQVAVLHGQFEPDIFAGYLITLAKEYNNAQICVERNNHGHTVLLSLEVHGYGELYISPFDKKPGWLTNTKTKVLSIDHTAQALRDGAVGLLDELTLAELTMIEAATLRAPDGDHDDAAMALIIGLAAIRWPSLDLSPGEGASDMIRGIDPLEELSF